jgi:diguanylate cyclase (GGDEF)-like protein
MGETAVVELAAGPYRYLTIAPIRFTDWSAVILYDSSPLLNMSLFRPVSVTMLVLLIAFALSVNAVGYRLIFQPLDKLERSLALLKENTEERVYGLERHDELGNLSRTIQDLFTKANYDALTGIRNRRFMENNFQQIMAFLSRSGGSLSVLMLDVDFFKKYNDAYGHEQGDACLKEIARTLADGLARANDFAARYGGEEFIAVLPDADEAGARLIAEKLLENVRGLNLPHADSQVAPWVTVSIGVTSGRVSFGQSWEDYVKRADEALYMSKQNGRNRYTYLDFTG